MAKPDWITLDKTSGAGNGAVIITALQNTSTSPRSGVITVRTGSISKVVTVTQEGAAASKGKITFLYTGEEIPQKYVGYRLYIGNSKVGSPEFYADYGEIESITDTDLTVNLDYLDSSALENILVTINGDMAETDDIYFGISPSDDPEADWIPLLYVNDPGDEDFTNQNMAAKIQSAFNGTNEIISCESLVVPSEPTCSWYLSDANLLLASITQKTLDKASTSAVTFNVFADLYPDGQRLNNDISMNNIKVGRFTLGAGSGQSLNKPVLVRARNSQFKWAKEWSTVALCRFTIKCNNYDIAATLNKNLIINGKTFTKHESGGYIYFENTEGIPLRKTTTEQTLNISSNYPTLTFNSLL